MDRDRNSLTTRGVWMPREAQESQPGAGGALSPKQIRDSGGEEGKCKDRSECKSHQSGNVQGMERCGVADAYCGCSLMLWAEELGL